MERFPVELLFVLGFIAFVLFNTLTQRAARRRQEQEPAQAQPAPLPVDEEVLEDIWGRTPAPPPPGPAPAPAPMSVLAPRPPAAPIAAPPPAHPVRLLLRDKRDLRRAVALMMVLGPCRALEPPER